jgi:hypothetical protein
MRLSELGEPHCYFWPAVVGGSSWVADGEADATFFAKMGLVKSTDKGTPFQAQNLR